jgi:non-reducing end alpha-L-arabinofuranosidase
MRTVARRFCRFALAGIVLLPLACKNDEGDGLLSLRISADPTNPPAAASRLVLTGTPGGITRTYSEEIRIQVGSPVEFQFPGIPASDVPITFVVRTYADDCQVGQSANTVTAAIKAGVETGPLDVILVSVGAGCADGGGRDAPMTAVDVGPSAEAGPGTGGAGGGRIDVGGAGVGGQAAPGSGGAGAGGQSILGVGGVGVGGQAAPGSGGAGAGGQLLSGGGGAGTGGRPGSGGAGTAGPGTGGAGVGGASVGSGGTGTGGRSSTGGSPPGTGGSGTGGSGTGGSGTGGSIPPGTGGAPPPPVTGPCDIYKSASTPCAAAHSTVRALFASYSGPLYQIRRADGMTADISTSSPGGFANAATQDDFCSGTTCVLLYIYDQTGKGNHLTWEAADSPIGGKDSPANIAKESLYVSGHKVYSAYLSVGNAYWVDGSAKGMPLASSPQGIYMVTSGTHYGSGCCFDYGNAETTRTYAGLATADALNFSSCTIWGTGAGSGPWVMADFEGGLYAQGSGGKNLNSPSLPYKYVTAVEKNNGTTEFALRGGDATAGNLSTFYKGTLPSGFSPMKKQGAIVLGSSGDCCYSNTNASAGTFYEGAIVAGYPSDTTDDAVQANVTATKYGQ